MSENNNFLEKNDTFSMVRFPFVNDEISLIAEFDSKSKKGKVIFQKINRNTKQIEFTLEHYEEIAFSQIYGINQWKKLHSGLQNDELYKKIKCQWDERDPDKYFTPELDSEEKWQELKSRIQAFSEMGVDAILFQSFVDVVKYPDYRITFFLLEGLIRSDASFLLNYVQRLNHNYKIGEEKDVSSVQANLQIILEWLCFHKFWDSENLSVIPFDEFGRDDILNILKELIDTDSAFLFDYIYGDLFNPESVERKFDVSNVEYDFEEDLNREHYAPYWIDMKNQIQEMIFVRWEFAKYPEYKRFLNCPRLKIEYIAKYNIYISTLNQADLNIVLELIQLIPLITSKTKPLQIPKYSGSGFPSNRKLEPEQNRVAPWYSNERFNMNIDLEAENGRIISIFFGNESKIQTPNSLPDSIWELTALKSLSLFGFPISVLSDKIENLHNLEVFCAKTSHLTALPDDICNLPSLRHLDLSNNELTSLPDNIGNLKSLQDLLLENNKIVSLPKSILKIKGLRWLELKNNNLRSIPIGFLKFPYLRYLNIQNNPCSRIYIFLSTLVEKLYKVRLYFSH